MAIIISLVMYIVDKDLSNGASNFILTKICPGVQVLKLFFMLNSAETKIYPAF